MKDVSERALEIIEKKLRLAIMNFSMAVKTVESLKEAKKALSEAIRELDRPRVIEKKEDFSGVEISENWPPASAKKYEKLKAIIENGNCVLHIGVIVNKYEQIYGKFETRDYHKEKNSIQACLSANPVFTNHGKAMFGLSEWVEKEKSEAQQ